MINNGIIIGFILPMSCESLFMIFFGVQTLCAYGMMRMCIYCNLEYFTYRIELRSNMAINTRMRRMRYFLEKLDIADKIQVVNIFVCDKKLGNMSLN